jgi:hypothetical protein
LYFIGNKRTNPFASYKLKKKVMSATVQFVATSPQDLKNEITADVKVILTSKT